MPVCESTSKSVDSFFEKLPAFSRRPISACPFALCPLPFAICLPARCLLPTAFRPLTVASFLTFPPPDPSFSSKSVASFLKSYQLSAVSHQLPAICLLPFAFCLSFLFPVGQGAAVRIRLNLDTNHTTWPIFRKVAPFALRLGELRKWVRNGFGPGARSFVFNKSMASVLKKTITFCAPPRTGQSESSGIWMIKYMIQDNYPIVAPHPAGKLQLFKLFINNSHDTLQLNRLPVYHSLAQAAGFSLYGGFSCPSPSLPTLSCRPSPSSLPVPRYCRRALCVPTDCLLPTADCFLTTLNSSCQRLLRLPFRMSFFTITESFSRVA